MEERVVNVHMNVKQCRSSILNQSDISSSERSSADYKLVFGNRLYNSAALCQHVAWFGNTLKYEGYIQITENVKDPESLLGAQSNHRQGHRYS